MPSFVMKIDQFFVPEVTVEPDNILRFFIGDTLGAIVFFLFLSFLFSTLADLKLVRRYQNSANKVDMDK